MANDVQVRKIKWLRIDEVAELLGVHQNTVRRWCDTGEIQCVRLPGGKGERRFTEDQVADLLKDMGIDPTTVFGVDGSTPEEEVNEE